jgi:hypothetical protein
VFFDNKKSAEILSPDCYHQNSKLPQWQTLCCNTQREFDIFIAGYHVPIGNTIFSNRTLGIAVFTPHSSLSFCMKFAARNKKLDKIVQLISSFQTPMF